MASQSKYLSKLAGKRVLVLGGTSGIGFCVAEAAVEHGATVIVSGSRKEKLQKTIDRLRASYPNATEEKISGYTCDLADKANLEANIETLLRNATQDGSKINHIAFTAGDALQLLPLSEITVDKIEQMFIVRFYAAVLLAKLVPKYMDVSAGSSLTLTGGTNTDKPMPNFTLPAGVGGAGEALVRALAIELKPLRVNLVSPGGVYTELFDSVGNKDAVDSFLESIAANTTTGEYGRPEDVAEAYIYAMKDRFASGGIINSNGGRLLA